MDDILDIDELTKDDSFFSLDDKDHDVCNIIQQWKNKQEFQTTQLQSQTQNNDKAYRVNSRTFTRPKRKSAAQNLESQFNGISEQQNTPCQPSLNLTLDTTTTTATTTTNSTPMLNVQIGGRIRAPMSARAMLRDTSPPSCMDFSLDSSPMDNSLVTSADFSNVDFLLSTPSLDNEFNNGNGNGGNGMPARYTLSDMIRDRKALESLTLSGDDGTLIKDSQIAQIDDISLALCKASSGSSTMGNSTESVEGNSSSGYGYNSNGNGNTTFGLLNERTMCEAISGLSSTFTSERKDDGSRKSIDDGNNGSALQQTMVLSNNEELISDTTFSLIENGQSFVIERAEAEGEQQQQQAATNTKLAVVPQMNETHNVDAADEHSETFCLPSSDKVQEQTPKAADTTYDCELGSPEEFRKPMHSISTPHHHHAKMFNNGINAFLPSVNMIREDVNISPIVRSEEAMTPQNMTTTVKTNETAPMSALQTNFNKTSSGVVNACSGSPISHLHVEYDNMEMLENIEMPHNSELKAMTPAVNRRRSRTRLLNTEYELAEQQQQQQSPQQLQAQLDLEQMRLDKSTIEMQDIMDLVEAEAELLNAAGGGSANLGNGDEEEHFEHMLDELGRIELNAEQLKMKKSVETIKKRFNCTLNGGSGSSGGGGGNSGEAHLLESASSKTFTSETREEALRQLRDEMSRNHENSWQHNSSKDSNSTREHGNSCLSSTVSNTSMATSGGSGGNSGAERLLSRRSRLYDDINLSTIAATTTTTAAAAAEPISAAMTTTTIIAPVVQTEQMATATATGIADLNEKTEVAGTGGDSHDDVSKYKLQEKRERDRDRFKTIKIVKNPNNDFGYGAADVGGVDCGVVVNQNELKVPCIDADEDDCYVDVANAVEAANATQQHQHQRASRRDYAKADALTEAAVAKTSRTFSANKFQTNTNFLTYKKPKETTNTKLNRPEVVNNQTKAAQPLQPSSKLNGEVRSLSRPRYISGLQKCSVVSKAASADDLENTEAVSSSNEGKTTQLSRLFANSKKISYGNANGSRIANAYAAANSTAATTKGELKSPMGLKAKSLHNLSSNLNSAAYSTGIAAPTSRLSSYGLRKINSGGINSNAEQQKQQAAQAKTTSNSMRPQKTATSANSLQSQQAVFKKPQRITGLRPAAMTNGATTGARSAAANVARPSSGYYSLNAVPKAEVYSQNSDDFRANQNKVLPNSGKCANESFAKVANEPQQLTRITIGASGIPKPSGLRPPTKLSGLPLPNGLRR